MLLDVHDNVVDIIQLYCMELLIILERYDKAAILRDGVLQPMQQGDYRRALDNLQDFVLNDISMFRLFPQLVDRAEPGLDILQNWPKNTNCTNILTLYFSGIPQRLPYLLRRQRRVYMLDARG